MDNKSHENAFNLLRLKFIDYYGADSIKMGYADYVFKLKEIELLNLFLKEIELNDNSYDISLISDLIRSGDESNFIIAANLINQSKFKENENNRN